MWDTAGWWGTGVAVWAQTASVLLAFCHMRTLYLRNVPDDVAERLERLAARQRMSVSAFAVHELTEVARRADNEALLAGLPDLAVEAHEVVADVEAGRSER